MHGSLVKADGSSSEALERVHGPLLEAAGFTHEALQHVHGFLLEAAGSMQEALEHVHGIPLQAAGSVREALAKHAVMEYGQSDLKEHESPESRREGGAMSLFARGPVPSTQ